VPTDSLPLNLRASTSEIQQPGLSPHTAPSWSFVATTVVQEVAVKGMFKTMMMFLFCVCCVMPALCGCFLFCCGMGVGHLINKSMNNPTAKEMNLRYEENCPKEQRKKYDSADFRSECDQMFDMADTDKDGTLDLVELKVPVEKYMKGGSHAGLAIDDLMGRFNDDDDEGIDKKEFFRMMQYLSWVRDGGDNERQKSYGSTGDKKDKKDKKEKKDKKDKKNKPFNPVKELLG